MIYDDRIDDILGGKLSCDALEITMVNGCPTGVSPNVRCASYPENS